LNILSTTIKLDLNVRRMGKFKHFSLKTKLKNETQKRRAAKKIGNVKGKKAGMSACFPLSGSVSDTSASSSARDTQPM